MENLTVVNPKDIAFHPRNYNRHSEAQVEELARSLDIFDQFKNIVGWRDPGNDTLYVIAGEGLVRAALKRGLAEITVNDRSDLSEDRAMALMLADNLLPSDDFDPKKTAELVRIIDSVEEVPGVTPDWLVEALGKEKKKAKDSGPQVDKAAELQEKWSVAEGDLWQIGNHRLICGDCTDETVVARVMGGEGAHLIITSPPYPGASMWKDSQEDLQDSVDRLDELNKALLQAAYDLVNTNGVVLWNVADVPTGNHGVITTTTTTTTTCDEVGFTIRGVIIWDKGSPHLTPPSFMRRPCIPTLGHERILLLFKGDWKPREKKSGIPQEYKRWMALSVWPIATASAKEIGHKAPFPLELPVRCINLWSLDNDIVVDLCVGSGTTLVACEQLSRRGRGIEIEPKYCAVTLERMSQMGLETKRVSQ